MSIHDIIILIYSSSVGRSTSELLILNSHGADLYMCIGLKRGTVALCGHEKEWEINALRTIGELKSVFGDTAADIRHVGSTSIKSIIAKPIIDIAVGVSSLEVVAPLISALAAKGFVHCSKHDTDEHLLFVSGDFENDISTHYIHVMKYGGTEWVNYINFRDCLNENTDMAKEYEALKLRLAEEYPRDREAYTTGKAELIKRILRKALVWSFLGKTVTVKIDRPLGSVHPRHKDIVYPVNYGYIPGVIGGDGAELDAYLLGVDVPVEEFSGRVIGIVHRENDVEDKLVAAPEGMRFNQAEIAGAVRFQEQFFLTRIEPLYHKSCGAIVYRRENGKTEFLCLYQKRSKTWSFPKGHAEAGETEKETAIREVFEETGFKIIPAGGFREEITYPVKKGEKTVALFLAEAAGEQSINPEEVGSYIWAPAAEIREIMSNPGYGEIIGKAEEFVSGITEEI